METVKESTNWLKKCYNVVLIALLEFIEDKWIKKLRRNIQAHLGYTAGLVPDHCNEVR